MVDEIIAIILLYHMKQKSKTSYTQYRPSSPQKRIESFTHRIRTLPTSAPRKLTLDQLGHTHIEPFQKDIARCLERIGSSPHRRHYTPTKQEQQEFRTQRYVELRSDFCRRKRKIIPFEFELDEIVLDCYDYKEKHGRRSIWKKYRGDVDQLSF